MDKLILGLLCIGCAAVTACATQSVQPIAASTATAPPPPPPSPQEEKVPYSTAHPRYYFDFVLFDFDSAEIRRGRNGTDAVDYTVRHLTKNPEVTVVLEGHTCSIGSLEYNMSLGQRRADAVRDFMLERGIDPSRLAAVSFGSARPMDADVVPPDHPFQRRVVFVLRMSPD